LCHCHLQVGGAANAAIADSSEFIERRFLGCFDFFGERQDFGRHARVFQVRLQQADPGFLAGVVGLLERVIEEGYAFLVQAYVDLFQDRLELAARANVGVQPIGSHGFKSGGLDAPLQGAHILCHERGGVLAVALLHGIGVDGFEVPFRVPGHSQVEIVVQAGGGKTVRHVHRESLDSRLGQIAVYSSMTVGWMQGRSMLP